MKKTKDEHIVCPHCFHSGFWFLNEGVKWPMKPIIVCDKCRESWTYGVDGGQFAHAAMNPKYPIPEWAKDFFKNQYDSMFDSEPINIFIKLFKKQ